MPWERQAQAELVFSLGFGLQEPTGASDVLVAAAFLPSCLLLWA